MVANDAELGTSGTRRPSRRKESKALPTPAASHVNMEDIARAAGVSMATTSRALNGAYGVSEKTRARVLQVAAELSYVVSPAASALSGGSTGRIAVVVPHLSRWFFGEMLNGIESVFRQANLDLMLYHVGDAENRRSFFHDLPARRKVDAVLVVGIPVNLEEQERLALMGVGVVAAGGQSAPYPLVSIDDEKAGWQAMNHLLHLGHRRIAMIDAIDPHAVEWPIDGRALAYTEALKSVGVELDPELLVRSPWGPDEGATAMAELLTLREPPTAVFVHSDEIAFGALRAIRQAGLRVPEDISVIGIDDHPLSAQVGLTSVRQDVFEQGQAAGRLVLGVLGRADGPPSSTIVPTRLVPRGSTARVADPTHA